jgi:phage I-like protein
MQEFGYIVKLDDVEIAESGLTWLQAMPLGNYNHPKWGAINVTPERAARFAQNVKANVRETELDIDYDHKEKTTEAAGWIKDAEARLGGADPTQNGLWIAVEFTSDAKDKIKNKAYKYFSPEFADEWTHPKKGETYTDVLFGGGLTNRPFLKDILPINLSEMPGGYMLEEMRKLLGLPDDADEASALAKLQEKLNPSGTPEPTGDAPVAPAPDVKEPVAASEPKPATTVQTLAETDPIVKSLVEEVDSLKAAIKLQETNIRVAKLNEGAKLGVTPAAIGKIKDLALELPTTIADKFFSLVEELTAGNGLVDLSEHGKPVGNDAGATATKKFNDAAEKYAKENEVSFADATSAVATADPDLFSAYRAESYVRENQ